MKNVKVPYKIAIHLTILLDIYDGDREQLIRDFVYGNLVTIDEVRFMDTMTFVKAMVIGYDGEE